MGTPYSPLLHPPVQVHGWSESLPTGVMQVAKNGMGTDIHYSRVRGPGLGTGPGTGRYHDLWVRGRVQVAKMATANPLQPCILHSILLGVF